MPFTIVVHVTAKAELDALRAFERTRVADAIDRQLMYEPTVLSRARKNLGVVKAGFEYDAPLWELKVGDLRVFYTVNDETRTVYVQSVRQKPAGATTAEVLR